MSNLNFVGIAGSLRQQSYNRYLLQAIKTELEKNNDTLDMVDIGSIPFFNQELEENFPAAVTALKEKIKQADGIFIATPEYNRGVPGVLKNTIDWTSRPYGQNAWNTKPVIVIGASTSILGTAIAQSQLKHTMLHLNARVLGQPEFYLGQARDKFNEQGTITDEQTLIYLTEAVAAFRSFTAANKTDS